MTTLRRACLIFSLLTLPGVAFGLIFASQQYFPDRVPPRFTPQEFGLKVQELAMQSADGVATKGWYIAPPREPAPAMLVVHGYSGRRERMLQIAAFLNKAGYGVAMMDLRHHGASGDAAVSFGIREAWDIAPYLEFLLARPAHRGHQIGAMGCSLGGVSSLRLASQDPRIAAVVADSPFDSLSDMCRWRLKKELPSVLVPYCWFFTLMAGSLTTGVNPAEWEVADWLPRIAPRPIMLIHGEVDQRIPVECSKALISAAKGPCESWLVPGADHMDAMDKKDEYAGRITAFLQKNVK